MEAGIQSSVLRAGRMSSTFYASCQRHAGYPVRGIDAGTGKRCIWTFSVLTTSQITPLLTPSYFSRNDSLFRALHRSHDLIFDQSYDSPLYRCLLIPRTMMDTSQYLHAFKSAQTGWLQSNPKDRVIAYWNRVSPAPVARKTMANSFSGILFVRFIKPDS
jgi:hypothetical protein